MHFSGRLTIATGLAVAAAITSSAVRSDDVQSPLPSFATGLEPVTPDQYAELPAVTRYRAFLPARVDLTDRFPPPGDQGQQGSCAAWASSYAARSFLAGAEAGAPNAVAVMSPSYVFNQTRPGPSCMRGIGLTKALDFLQRNGTVPMADFPAANDCNVPPPAMLGDTAARYRIGGYKAVQHRNEKTGALNADWRDPIVIDDIKGGLSRGRPVVFGMQLPADFMVPLMGFVGVYKSTDRYDRWGGGAGKLMHAMAVVGYDDDRQAFRILNSWSARWGDRGYLWIDYRTFTNLVGEAYVVEPTRALTPPAPPAPPASREDPRAALTNALAAPICGKVVVRWQGEVPTVTGFARPEDLTILRARAAALANVRWQVRSTPFPVCEAELMLSEGLVDGSVRIGIADDAGRTLDASVVTLTEDALFSIDVESAAKPYLQVFYLQADGSAVELYRGAPTADANGRVKVRVGAAGATERRFQVASPFGEEALIVVAGAGPVIAESLGSQATEREFLSRLKTAIVAARGGRPSATLRRLRTMQRG